MLNRFAFPIVFAVFGLIALAYVANVLTARSDRARIELEVFAPYFTALNEGRYPEAWALHTVDWRGRHPESEFTDFYKKLLADEGPVDSRNWYGSRRLGLPWLGAPGTVVDYQIYLKKSFYTVSFTIVAGADGRYLIDRGVATNGNMRLENALPW